MKEEEPGAYCEFPGSSFVIPTRTVSGSSEFFHTYQQAILYSYFRILL